MTFCGRCSTSIYYVKGIGWIHAGTGSRWCDAKDAFPNDTGEAAPRG